MPFEPQLLFALLALEWNRCTSEQLVQAFVAWLEERKDPAAPAAGLVDRLSRECGISDAERAVLLESGGSATLPELDPSLRAMLISLCPDAAIADWLRNYRAGRPAEPEFEPAPRERRYELGAEIARGGLGRVVEAHDADLDREIAVKLLLEGNSRTVVERFLREARITAALDHPNIVPVHDFGVVPAPDGSKQMFLCMKRVRGRDLLTLLRSMAAGEPGVREAWSRARLLGVFQGVCQGMAYAHSKGVVHRDLKPGNVMIGDYGETYIVDWGLAKRHGEDEPAPESGERPSKGWGNSDATSLTIVGQIIGTPAYMPPEQAEGRLADMDERGDVYSLGAILYAILTWQPPFEGASSKVLEDVIAGRLQRPSDRVEHARTLGRPAPDPVPAALEAICLRAMACRREDRYASARELHDEIQLFLEGIKERERRAEEATRRCAEGATQMQRFLALRSEAEEARRRAERVTIGYATASAEERANLWRFESRAEELTEEAADAWSRASLEFGLALEADPDRREAHDGRCELILQRFLDAERRRDRQEIKAQRHALAQADRFGTYQRRLDAPGRLTLRVSAYSCDCLRPATVKDFQVEFDDSALVAWEDGRPVPGQPPTPEGRPVPATRILPPGTRWGHAPDCPREELKGVEVRIRRYEEVKRRLVPGEGKILGVSPMSGVELAPGSWRCEVIPPAGSGLAPAIVPVNMERGGTWTQDVVLYPANRIPAGFVLVPGGPFIFGGTWAGGNPHRSAVTRDFFAARFHVTLREYIEFLNDLVSAGRPDEAARRQLRGTEGAYLDFAEGRYRVSSGKFLNTELDWDPEWPAIGMTWHDALAYAAWKSRRDGRVYRLLHEEEFEKASRGVDGRTFSFGNRYEPSFSHSGISNLSPLGPRPVGTFPIDESPYGVRDTNGGAMAWGFNAGYDQFRTSRSIRGGYWAAGWARCASAVHGGALPGNFRDHLGLRLAVSPVV